MKQNGDFIRELISGESISGKRLAVITAAGAAAGFMTTVWYGCCFSTVIGRLLFPLGAVGMGLFLWALTCTLIAVTAKSPLHAVADVFCYLAPMLVGCCAAARITDCWLNSAVMTARLMALIPAAALGAAAWYLRRSEGLRIAALIAGGLLVLFDIRIMIGMELPAIAIEGALFFAFYTVLRHLGEDQREQILYRRNFMGSCEPLNRF